MINYIPAPGYIVVQAKIDSDKPSALEAAGVEIPAHVLKTKEEEYIKDGNPLLVISANIPNLPTGESVYPALVEGVKVLVGGQTRIQQIEVDDVRYCTVRWTDVIGVLPIK